MISANTLRRIAKEEEISAGIAEKDYVLTWLIHGIYRSKLSGKLVFMGGTAIRKVYFPAIWRFSEDLDFACPFKISSEDLKKELSDALSKATEDSGITFSIDSYHYTTGHVTSRIQYTGPLGVRNNIRIDIHLREKLVSEPVKVNLKSNYPDIKDFKVLAYPIKEILIEKMRSIMQRGKSRDYYDVWRLLNEQKFDKKEIKNLFKKKCTINNIKYEPELMFNKKRLKEAEDHWNKALQHLTKELPDFKTVIKELEEMLE